MKQIYPLQLTTPKMSDEDREIGEETPVRSQRKQAKGPRDPVRQVFEPD